MIQKKKGAKSYKTSRSLICLLFFVFVLVLLAITWWKFHFSLVLPATNSASSTTTTKIFKSEIAEHAAIENKIVNIPKPTPLQHSHLNRATQKPVAIITSSNQIKSNANPTFESHELTPRKILPHTGGNTTTSKKLRVAIAITMTKDGSFLDGAAVLAYTVHHTKMSEQFDVSFIAFVHPNVTTSRPVLKTLGYHVIVAPTPINTTAIKFEFLREKINKNGCCGAAELIKLNSYRLTQYDVVVHMDADTYFLNPISELFQMPYSLIYTTDPNMATFKAEDKQPAQGGFLVMKPSVDDYEGLINILLTCDFVIHQGWNRSQIGWFWGGMTVQGVLPYYYNRITKPGRSIKIDRCIYNTMADVPECMVQNLTDIKSAHFTVCQKPWNCEKYYYNPLCEKLHKEWFRMRTLAEEFYSLSPHPRPCPRGGPRNYVPMDLGLARLKDSSVFKPDETPDVLLPIGNSGFNDPSQALLITQVFNKVDVI